MPDYGSGGEITVTMDGPFAGGSGGTSAVVDSVSVSKNNWKGATSPYTQSINILNANVNSKVDLQLDGEQIEQLNNQIISFTVENRGGDLTIYAIGDKPDSDIVFQVELTDVLNVGDNTGIIFGNTVSTNTPRADFAQKNELAGDFIKNKPELVDMSLLQITLMASQWENKKQTVLIPSVEQSSRQAVITVSAPDSLDVYLDCNIHLFARGDGAITFECDDVPGSDVFVNVLILQKGEVQNG